MSDGSVNVAEWLAENMPPMPREQADRLCAASWDAMTAYVKASSDEKLRADNPGIGDEDIARWRRNAEGPNPWRTQPGTEATS